MKNLMKLFSLLLVLCLVAIIATSSIFSLNDIPDIASKLSLLLTSNIIPIIIIAICCLCIQRKDESFLIRITLFYMVFSIILSALIIFLPLQDINKSLASIVNTTYNFITQTHLYLLAYSLLSVVKPNNVICNTIKKIAYIAIIANIVVQLWVIIKEEMIETLPNVYGYQGFNFSSLKDTAEIAYKVVFISMYVEVMAIILTYITNYAFEQDTIESENLNYEELKMQADEIAKTQIENIYTPKAPEILPDRSVSESTGLMNINNQLGANSNVGQVKDSNKLPQTFVDRAIPTTSRPIINNSLTNNQPSQVNNDTNNTQNNNSQFNNQPNTPPPSLLAGIQNTPVYNQNNNQNNQSTNKFIN